MANYTPGPWSVCRENPVMVRGADDTRIADCDNFVVQLPDCEANARLIAAAPDLTEALRPFVKEFEERREAYIRRYPRNPGVGARNFDDMPDEWEMENSTFSMGAYRRARTALLKALGEGEAK